MSEHTVKLEWQRTSADFRYEAYSRNHTVSYGPDGKICASSAAEFFGDPRCIDPEQAFVMALASCHLLTFLAIASKKGFVVDRYTDAALGTLGKNEMGRTAMTKIVLKPEVVFSGNKLPSPDEFIALHERAHQGCFIANSIASCVKVIVEPRMG